MEGFGKFYNLKVSSVLSTERQKKETSPPSKLHNYLFSMTWIIQLTNEVITMFKSISQAIQAIFRTVEKTAHVVESTVDLADHEIQLLHERQGIRMVEIRNELEAM